MWWKRQNDEQKNAEVLDKTYQCPLCGHHFTAEDSDGCRSCPRFLRCSLVMCPNCSHEFPPPD